MIEIGVDQNEFAIGVAEFCDVVFKEPLHLWPQHVIARIAGRYGLATRTGSWGYCRHNSSIVLTPGEQMG